MNWVDVPLEKQKISITKHRFQNGGTTQAKPNEQLVVESGECNIRFRLKIISLERINKIFDEIREQVATDNLETEPRNVTLNSDKVVTKTAKSAKKQNKKEEKEKEEEEIDERIASYVTYMSTETMGLASAAYNLSASDLEETTKAAKKTILMQTDQDVPKMIKVQLNAFAK